MDAERFDSRTERSQVMEIEDEMEDDGDERSKESSRYRTRDRDKSSRRDEKDHRSKERDRDVRDERVSSRDRRKDERDEREKDWRKDYREERDKHRDRDREQERERERERERDRDRKDRAKERDREIDKEIDHRTRDKERGKEDRSKDKGGREKERDRVKEKEREKHREKERDRDGEKERDRERATKKGDEVDHHDREKDHRVKLDSEQGSAVAGREQNSESASDGARISTSEFEERILKAREERVKKKSESASEVMEWVSRSRKLDERRNSEKQKAAQLARIFEEQDNIGEEGSEDEEEARQTSHHLAGVKVLHGLDKVIEGGAVVLTLKDQDILANGDINEEVDMLENVEIGEQKRREEAYKASKKKTGVYDDKFNDDTASEKKMLPQYDDPVTDEGVTLDARGRLTGAAEKKLEELRRRLEGASTGSRFEDLTSTSRVSLDYYTQEEMIQFKKPKKKKSLRKKEKLDLDALEAEAVSAGLGAGDLGSRSDVRRQAIREEQERSEAERRNNAYQAAYAKAEEASKLLRMEQTLPVKTEEEENVILDNDEDFYKSLERARKLALKKQKEDEASGPKAIALLAATTPSIQTAADENQSAGEGENRVVITEMEEFVWGLQLNEESRKPDSEDVFMDEDEAPVASDNEQKDEGHGWIEVDEPRNDNNPLNNDEEEIAPDETIHEAAVGKGLSGALKLLKERGTLKETIEWGGRNMDKKKSKLVGIADEEGPKEIRIERRDEFGRILTPKEAFRSLSHKFHGKGPGKKKQEKRMKQYQEELKLKQMKNADTPSLSAERMREAQAQMKTPYLVLSGHVKPGQNSDPRSAFATIEKDTGSLTPMLGDRKVEHFLGIKCKPDSENMGPLKKPKT